MAKNPLLNTAAQKIGGATGSALASSLGAGPATEAMSGGALGSAASALVGGGSAEDVALAAGRGAATQGIAHGAAQQGMSQVGANALGAASGPYLGALTQSMQGITPSGESMASSMIGAGVGAAFGGPIGIAASLAASMLMGGKKAPRLKGDWEGGVEYNQDTGTYLSSPVVYIPGEEGQGEDFSNGMSNAGQRRANLAAQQLNEFISQGDYDDEQKEALARYATKRSLVLPRLEQGGASIKQWASSGPSHTNVDAFSSIAKRAPELMRNLDTKEYYNRDPLQRSISSKHGFDPGRKVMDEIDWYRERKGIGSQTGDDYNQAAARNFSSMSSDEIVQAAADERAKAESNTPEEK